MISSDSSRFRYRVDGGGEVAIISHGVEISIARGVVEMVCAIFLVNFFFFFFFFSV